ncbi:MAG: DUF4340 domain-containing protein, partial [Nitrospira sp.]|nr:DUF4340 domain-containing protein [Nitrospira sp.]
SEKTKIQVEVQDKRLLPLTEREVTGLTVRTPVGEVVLELGQARSWRITAPLKTEADVREVEALIRALVVGKVSRIVEEKAAALAPFGLEQPPVVITVKAGPRQETLSLGESGPISSTLYAMRASDKKILLTDVAPKDVFNKTLLTLRKKDILDIDPAQVDRLRLTYPGTEIVLYRQDQGGHAGSPEQTPPMESAGKTWKIRAPIEAGADQTEVRTLLMKLEALKAIGFIDSGPQHDAFLSRLTRPAVKVTAHQGSSDRTLRLFQPDAASGEAYAVASNDEPIYRINPAAIKDLTKELFTLQDKRLLGMDRDEIAMLSVKTPGQHYVLINQNGDWVLEDQPSEILNQEAADIFVSRVVNLPAELRALKQAGPLAPYGLASPAAEFTAMGKDGKQHGRLMLGSSSGGLVYAMGQGLTGVFQARADLLTQIPSKADLKSKERQVSGMSK